MKGHETGGWFMEILIYLVGVIWVAVFLPEEFSMVIDIFNDIFKK